MADPQRFRISVTHTAQLQFALLQRRATLFGVGERVIASFQEIDRQLETRPLERGEPSHTLRGMGMTLCTGFQDRIRVTYGVHEAQRQVVIREFEAQPGHPLHRDADSDT